jgi:hypothetical protein
VRLIAAGSQRSIYFVKRILMRLPPYCVLPKAFADKDHQHRINALCV